MIVRDEILFDLERRFQRMLYLILVLFIIISTLFLIFIGGFDANPMKLQNEVKSTLLLKLSSNDLMALYQTDNLDKWTNVQMLERNREEYPVKIKPVTEYTFDFKLNVNGTIYNLFRVGQEGKAIYDLFNSSSAWGLEASNPQLIQLKVNNVFIGIYVMEEQIYDQIRDENGQYFIRLNSDTRLMRRILYQVRHQLQGQVHLLEEHFDTQKMAAYIVFFSLFSYDEVLDFDRLVFRYDPDEDKFIPYLTMASVILSLQEQNKQFKTLPLNYSTQANKMSPKHVDSLLARAGYYKYNFLVRKVLAGSSTQVPGRFR
jgi:hypothetical protein